ADGQVRKITKVFSVGQHLSVYFDGPLLDGAKVGAPNTVSTVTVSNTAPGTSAPKPTPTPEPTPEPAPAPEASVGFTSQINRFTSGDWLNGVWRREAGVSIPLTSGARDAFKPGVQVRFADGQVRKISKVFVVGSNLSVYFEGGLLDGNKVGAPRTISTLGSTSKPSTPTPAPQPKPEPQPDTKPAPEAPSESTYSTGMNSFTNEDWENGIYRKQAGFSIRNTAGNKAAFKQGASVRLADGQVRQVIAVYDIGEHLTVLLSGDKLSPSNVGYPK